MVAFKTKKAFLFKIICLFYNFNLIFVLYRFDEFA